LAIFSELPAWDGESDEIGGADGIRTHDLLDAIEARSQLRHGPTGRCSDVSIRARGSSTKGVKKGAETFQKPNLARHGKRAGLRDHNRDAAG
jgi:hypothetical protein